MKIKKGDTVLVIAGSDRGKRGEVLKVLPQAGRVIVAGVNQRKKHQRGGRQTGSGRQMGAEIVTFNAPMDVSNVMLICPKCGEPTRIRRQRDENGAYKRQCRKCEVLLD